MSNTPKLNTVEAAAYLGIRPNTLEVWRTKHKGPRYSKIGRRVLYDLEELEAYFAANSVTTVDAAMQSQVRER